jgi:hypothetical protein
MATYQGQTVDVYEDFEDALGAGWTETDVNSVLNPNDSAAKYAGTNGMSWDPTGAYAAQVVYDTGSNRSSVSLGYWFRLPTQAIWEYGGVSPFIMDDGASENCRLYFGGTGASPQVYNARLRNNVGTYSSEIIIPASNVWYWITIQMVQNGNLSLSIYNASQAQVGSTVTVAAGNLTFRTFRLQSSSLVSTIPTYWDDFILDYTDATFPLLGWSVAGAGTSIPAMMAHYARLRV